MKLPRTFLLVALLAVAAVDRSDEFGARCTDREAIERIYYNHRLGQKPPFEQTLPPATLESLVRLDLRKEALLKKNYGVEITPAMLDAEVQRINTTTRAPEVLAEIKAALDNDSQRFANVFARPIVVERLLREKFDNDDALHAPQRKLVEVTRSELLSSKTNGADAGRLLALLKQKYTNAVVETTWQLTPHPPETNAPATDEIEIKKRFGPDAQVISTPPAGNPKETRYYFEDLPAGLQNVLRVQLRRPGDVSAVIEMPGGFLLCVAKERTDASLSAAVLSLPKRSYEEWLQTEGNP
jgi:hypothetical protein